MKYLDPKADLTFKKIFGNHPARLISLLNALLPLSEEEQIQDQVSAYRTCAPARRGQEYHCGCSLHRHQRQEVLRGDADGMV